MAVIIELVANHTSIDHPWFVSATSSRDSELRGLYIWRDEPLKTTEMGDLSYLVDLFSDSAYGRPDPDAPDLTISGYGYRWLMGRLDGDHR